MKNHNDNSINPMANVPAPKKWYNHSGLPVISLIVIVVALAATAYWKFSQPEVAQVEDQNQMLTGLKHNVNSDAGSSDPSWLLIKEWGVTFKKPTGMMDLQYAQYGPSNDTVSFITQKLIDSDQSTGGKYCTLDQGPLGLLSRAVNFDGFKDSGHYIPDNIKIGDYYYYFTPPQATCSDNQTVVSIQESQRNALVSSILPTLKNADDSTSWTVYSNNQYGLEFRYPASIYGVEDLKNFAAGVNEEQIIVSLYNIKEKEEAQKCQCGEYERFQVWVAKNAENLSAAEYAKLYFPNDSSNAKTTSVAGYQALEFGEMDKSILLVKDGMVFHIVPIDDILPTLKLTK